MESLLDQIKKGLDAELYQLALFVALSVPDICGAIESEDGRASPKKYKIQVKQNLAKNDLINMKTNLHQKKFINFVVLYYIKAKPNIKIVRI